MSARVIESLAGLTGYIEQIPDRKPFVARQHSGDAVALNVLHGSAKLLVDLFRAVELCNVWAGQWFRARDFLQDLLNDRGALLGKHLQTNGFQRNGLAAFRIKSLEYRPDLGTGNLTQDFKTPEFIGHISSTSRTPMHD